MMEPLCAESGARGFFGIKKHPSHKGGVYR